MNDIILKPGRDKTARQRHPWIFSGAIARVSGSIKPGEITRVLDAKKEFVAYGYYNARSQIRVRLLEWGENRLIDDGWWFSHIKDSEERRTGLSANGLTSAYRLVYGESDLLPGLIVDKYANFLVVQILTAGIEFIKPLVVSALDDHLSPSGIFERSDAESRGLEGLAQSIGPLSGNPPPDLLEIAENGLKILVDIKSGQKTGLYLDQRDNHLAVSAIAKGCDVLDCFSYSGGFTVSSLAGSAKSAVMIDSSGPNLKLAGENLRLNGADLAKFESIDGDVFRVLREFRSAGRRFDIVILDPPKFAPAKSDLKRALAAYKDINMVAMSILRPNGILVTFSCSGAVDRQTLQTVIFWASVDAGRPVQILKGLSQGPDHPRLASFPESEYLKGFICRVI